MSDVALQHKYHLKGIRNEKSYQTVLEMVFLHGRILRSCPCGQHTGSPRSVQIGPTDHAGKMRMLLKWLDDLMRRWTQSEMDRWFEGVNPDSIKDIDKFLRSKGWQ